MAQPKDRSNSRHSPKIRGDLIPRIYQMAKTRGLRMTELVNEILERALKGDDRGTEEAEMKGERERP